MNTPIEGVALLRRPSYLWGSKCNTFYWGIHRNNQKKSEILATATVNSKPKFVEIRRPNITKREKKAHTVMCTKQSPVECTYNYVEIVQESVYTHGS
jgi:hypothetical protein